MRFLLLIAAAAVLFAAAPPRTDAQLEQSIRNSFAKSKISADHFTVHVKGGVATIEGKTDIIQRKAWATRYAKLAGASRVINHIQVSESSRKRLRERLEAARRKKKTQPPKRAHVVHPAGKAPRPAEPVSSGSIPRAQAKH